MKKTTTYDIRQLRGAFAAGRAGAAEGDEAPRGVGAVPSAEHGLYGIRLAWCDECGKRADTLHFRSGDYPYPREDLGLAVDCYFACPKHDFEGYWVRIADWNKRGEHWSEHIQRKRWGWEALTALIARFDRRPMPRITNHGSWDGREAVGA